MKIDQQTRQRLLIGNRHNYPIIGWRNQNRFYELMEEKEVEEHSVLLKSTWSMVYQVRNIENIPIDFVKGWKRFAFHSC